MLTTEHTLSGRLRALFLTTGLPELAGGIEAFDAGMEELNQGLVVVAADLMNAERQHVDLADAVLDPMRFPHAARMHGIIVDLIDADVPGELEEWARRIARAGPFPEVREINHAIATAAVAASNPFHRVLARFALFELICFRHRLALKRDGVKLEAMNGRRRDVEDLADAEVEVACALAEGGADLLSLDDPVVMIEKMATVALARYVELLRRELASLSADMHEQLKRRGQILAAASRVEPADAILILNQTADEFGEERFTAAQLQQVHPLLLGELSGDAIYKRVERLPERIASGIGESGKSFGDLVIAIMQEVEK